MSAVFYGRRPWGRNECVTNEPQRRSSGRLLKSVREVILKRRRNSKSHKNVTGCLKEESVTNLEKVYSNTFLREGTE